MKTKLKLNDFKLDPISKMSNITGGQDEKKIYTTSFGCTDGDVGCCDNRIVDDAILLIISD